MSYAAIDLEEVANQLHWRRFMYCESYTDEEFAELGEVVKYLRERAQKLKSKTPSLDSK